MRNALRQVGWRFVELGHADPDANARIRFRIEQGAREVSRDDQHGFAVSALLSRRRGKETDTIGAAFVVGISLDAAAPLGNVQRRVDLGAAGRREPLLRFHLALACYRAGQFKDAVRAATESLSAIASDKPGAVAVRALDSAVLAMAHHRLGETARAASRLDAIKVIDWNAIEQWVEPQDWWQRADFLTLRREAIELITGSTPPPDPELHRRRRQAYAQLGRPEKAGHGE
jgi:hypothetical protein